MPGAEEAQVGHFDVRDMAVGGPVQVVRVQMRKAEKWPGGTRSIPGEYVAVRMPTGDGGMVCRYCNGSNGAGLDS
jgi:hypothetical protein